MHIHFFLQNIGDDECLVVGDFNVDLITIGENALRNVLYNCGLRPLLDISRSTTNSNTHIDWCMSNLSYSEAETFETVYSHHKAIAINVYDEEWRDAAEFGASKTQRSNELFVRIAGQYFDAESVSRVSLDSSALLTILSSSVCHQGSPDLGDVSGSEADVTSLSSEESSECAEEASATDHAAAIDVPVAESFRHAGLVNPSNACYANSVVQCLLSLETFRQAVAGQNDDVSEEIYKIMTKTTSSTKKVRSKVGAAFTTDQQQDVQEFLHALLEKLPVEFLSTVTVLVADVLRCDVCGNTRAGEPHDSLFYFLYFPSSAITKSVVSFYDLLGFQQTDITCNQCSSAMKNRSALLTVRKYVFLVFLRYCTDRSGQQVKIEAAIQDYVPERVQLDDHVLRTKAVICHQGHEVNSGHYIAIVRQDCGEWLQCNDRILSLLPGFDNSMQNVYIAVLEKVD